MEKEQREKLLGLFSEKLTERGAACTWITARAVASASRLATLMRRLRRLVTQPWAERRTYDGSTRSSSSFSGKIAPWLNEAVELDDDWMEKVYETAYTCTGCRRCMTFCPFGIDTQLIQSIAKLMLIGADMEPKVLSMLADVSIAKGENIDATKANFGEAVRGLESEVIQKWRSEAGADAIPLDVQGADVLYVALAGKHSIIPAAAIMNAAGEKWSLSYFEAVNFGAFVGHPKKTKEIAQRIVDEAETTWRPESGNLRVRHGLPCDEAHDRRAPVQGHHFRRADRAVPARRPDQAGQVEDQGADHLPRSVPDCPQRRDL